MKDKIQILIVEDSEITLYKLKAILIRLGYEVSAHDRPQNALDCLASSHKTPDLIISDVMMPGMDGYTFVKMIRANKQTAKVPVIMLTSQTDLKDKVAGLEAGADDFISKTVSPDELELRVKALLSRNLDKSSITQSSSKVFSVFSLRGGVGTTSIAVNLAIAISQLLEIKTCLWDMALSGGQCALMLNLKPKNTLASLADWPEGSIEEGLLSSMILDHASGISLLPAPQFFEEGDLVTRSTVELVWTPLQLLAPFIMVDAGNHFTDPIIAVLERSDAIIVPLAPELASVNAAYQALRLFEEMGIDHRKVLPVVNETFPKSSLTATKIAEGLKKEVFAEIPLDSVNMVRAINQGTPYMTLAPRTSTSAAFIKMAQRLTAVRKELEKDDAPEKPIIKLTDKKFQRYF
jgi:pilus assembly protein CpaE